MKKFLVVLFCFVATVCSAQTFVEVNLNESASYFILFGVASLILMIISNILFKKDYFTPVSVFVTAFVAAAFAALVAATFASIVVIAAVAFTAAVAAAFAAIANVVVTTDNSGKKIYKFFSVIYYIMMTILFVVLFV